MGSESLTRKASERMSKQASKQAGGQIVFALEIILFIVLSFFFVPKNDDLIFMYRFQINSFSDIIYNALYYGNGRILGNFFGFVFSLNYQIFYFVEGFLLAFIAWSTERIIELKNSRLIIMALFILQPICSFIETTSWISGFTNYVLPICFICAGLLFLKQYEKHKNGFLLFPIVIVGVCGQLFSEHTTIMNVLIILYIIIFIKLRNKATYSMLFSTIFGAGIMFLYNKYIDFSLTWVASRGEEYRRTIFSVPFKEWLINIFFTNIRFALVAFNSLFFLFFILFYLLFNVVKKTECRIYKIKVITALAFYVISLIIVNIWIFCYGDDFITGEFGVRDILFFVSAAVLMISMVIYLTITIKLLYKLIFVMLDKKNRVRIIGMSALLVFSYAPFLFVAPSGYRCSFLMTFIMVCVFVELFKHFYLIYGIGIDVPIYLVSGITCAAMIVLTLSYIPQKKAFNYRVQYYEVSDYLPNEENEFLNHKWDLAVFDQKAGFEHKYIPLDEFEQYIHGENQHSIVHSRIK